MYVQISGSSRSRRGVKTDPDVLPYIHERDIEIISVSLPAELEKALDHLNRLLDDRLKMLAGSGFSVPKRQQLSMKALNAINVQVQEKIRQREPCWVCSSLGLRGNYETETCGGTCRDLRGARF